MRIFGLTLLAILISSCSFAQFQVRDSALFDPHVSISFAYQTPGGDLANRFSSNLNVGCAFHIKTKKNWYYGVQGTYFFGNKVNEPGLLQNLYTENGEILDNQGQVAIISLQERGFAMTLNGGKILDFIGPNRNSGLLLMGGVGMLQHKIRIEHQENEVAQLEGDYLQGYDRLTDGLSLYQFAGYFHMANNKLANFFVGVEAYEAFTKGRRDLNFDTMTTDHERRFDLLVGIRLGWVLHLYTRTASDFYYN
ncbi:MAG: hypothetical protein SH856_14625 [Flavobacteriales bacterium]|nr:hypothetical protein [Flavobacteriales bacterium]